MQKPATDAQPEPLAHEWFERVDQLLARAEQLVGLARAQDAPLAERVTLWVDIVAVRRQLATARNAMDGG